MTSPHVSLPQDPDPRRPEHLTLAEAEAARATRPCDTCGTLGIEIHEELGNNGRFIFCPSCDKKHAWAGVLYLRHSTKPTRKEYPDGHSVAEVWARWGHRCFACGFLDRELTELRIGLQRHHVDRYAEHGHTGLIVPVCTVCHEKITMCQHDMLRLHKIIARFRGDGLV